MKNTNTRNGLKVFSSLTALMLLAACSGTKSTTVAELTKYDKHMSCEELQVDITEATFLRDKAERNRGLSFKNVVMPLSYPSTYLSAESAIEAASNRADYLTRLYEIKGCSAQGQYASAGVGNNVGYNQPPMPAPVMQPSPVGVYQDAPRYAAQPMHVQQQTQSYEFTPQYARPSYGY